MIKRLPFVPFPVEKAQRISHIFRGLASPIKRIYPHIELDLQRAEFGLSAQDYIAIAIFSGIFTFFFTFAGLFLVSLVLKVFSNWIFIISFLFSAILGCLSFVYITIYPTLKVSRRTKSLEKDLLFALRHLLVQVKSGVPLFNAMVTISKGGYGLVSEEFGIAVKQIHAGYSEVDALEKIATRNPSLYFRRVVWQMANAMKAGADIAEILSETVNNLAIEQRISIRKYGSELNPIAMMYMMTTVIIPALGISFIIILGSFSGMRLSDWIYWAILGFLIFFQYMFLGFVKSRRPVVSV